MKNGMSCLALGISLLTKTSFALGQTPSPTLIAQAPAFAPPSGVLSTAPPAPVAVPPSGVLVTPPTVERPVTTVPVKAAQTVQIAKRATPVTMRRHVLHRRSPTPRETITRTTTVDQSIVVAPSVISRVAEQSPHDGIGYELFLSQFGKAKE